MDFGFPRLQQWLGLSPCSNLRAPVVAGAEVIAMVATDVYNYTSPGMPPFIPAVEKGLDVCQVSVTLRHEGADDTVYVDVWLPPRSGWNGRYTAAGGGGLAAGFGGAFLGPLVQDGFAASSTDAGLTLNNTVDPQTGAWGLKADGSLNEDLLFNFLSRSTHDMAVVAKDLIQQYYRKPASYSYWSGCSQGGRQGYTAAATHPADFDGILANAPAIGFDYLIPALFWPPVVMQNGKVLPMCIFNAYQAAIVEKCDPLDGAKDGLISDPDLLTNCPFDTDSLVGTTISCEDDCEDIDPVTKVPISVPCRKKDDLTITSTDAAMVAKILEGPRTSSGEWVGHGVAPGAGFWAVAKTVLNSEGVRVPSPFVPSEGWIKYLTLQDPSYDLSKMSYADFFKATELSKEKFNADWGNKKLDFTGFKQAGGKLLTWVGLADEYIAPPGILSFRKEVEKQFGSAEVADEFYRLFPAPGVGHCHGGVGPIPIDALGVLRAWVERGEAPDTMHASVTNPEGIEVTRELCRHPKKLVYKEGDVNLASSFVCE